MPASVKCISVDIANNGSRSIAFDDGISLDFPTLQDVKDYISDLETKDLARKFLLGRYLGIDPDGSDTAGILNRTANINVTAANPVQIG